MKISQLFIILCMSALHDTHIVHSPSIKQARNLQTKNLEELQSIQFWLNDAQRALLKKLEERPIERQAKNVIFFIGDGMSIPTVTAGRIYDGQKKGILGERNQLSFDEFPYVGLAKTYCTDKQVADSACSATAYLRGVKANFYTLGVGPAVSENDCAGSLDEDNHVESIAQWAQQAGKSTGLVTTTRITHASPAALYAQTANRLIESDRDVELFSTATDPKCTDIAVQLLENDVSKNFKVILGGGTTKFLHNATKDDMGNYGERLDGRNLLREWSNSKGGNAQVISNRDQLLHTDISNTDFLMGLFSPSHLAYHLDADEVTQPTLEEMTEVAIKMLSKEEKGFFLFVEGGRIDHGHHFAQAEMALDETVEFSKAVQKAYELTNPAETLIVVSADHGHTMSISGFPGINNSITGLVDDMDGSDNLPYTTLTYANGPGFNGKFTVAEGDVKRVDIRTMPNFGQKNFEYPAPVPLEIETHEGTDVPIFATGPCAHLFSGVIEQNVIPHIMAYALCIGPGVHFCDSKK